MRPVPNLRVLASDGDGVLWCCECGDPSCRQHFHVPAGEASTLRERFPLGYVVAPDHVGAGERVVHSGQCFVVVVVAAVATIGSVVIDSAIAMFL